LKKLFEMNEWEIEGASNEGEVTRKIKDFLPFDVTGVDMCLSLQNSRKGEGEVRTIERICKKDPLTQIIAISTYMDAGDVLNNIYEVLKYNIYQNTLEKIKRIIWKRNNFYFISSSRNRKRD